MKKLLFVVLVVVMLAVTAVVAQADGAVVIKDSGCTMLDAEGNIVPLLADSDHRVATPSDNSKRTCKATIDPPADGKPVKWNYDNTGLFCLTPTGPTDQWQEVISASGQATLQCHTNPGN